MIFITFVPEQVKRSRQFLQVKSEAVRLMPRPVRRRTVLSSTWKPWSDLVTLKMRAMRISRTTRKIWVEKLSASCEGSSSIIAEIRVGSSM